MSSVYAKYEFATVYEAWEFARFLDRWIVSFYWLDDRTIIVNWKETVSYWKAIA